MIIAFVPLRGGSKSIPNKNIKPLYGKPLAYWSLSALSNSKSIDKIVVATDSQEIKNVVISFCLNKVEVYDRLPQNAEDHSSTESVMLEYLQSNIDNNEDALFILVQATSPFTKSVHFDEAIKKYYTGGFDSLLSITLNKRFFWSIENSQPINYDFTTRPRRQDFQGLYMENGAFYISTIKGVLNSNNRLSGKIGFYEMPEYSALELDEPLDWELAEFFMQKYSYLERDFSKIKLFFTDVDGTLTDAGMYYGNNGEELKKFNTHDGKGIELLRGKQIKVGLITSENTPIVANRALKLQVEYLFQGVAHGGKLETISKLCDSLNLSLSNVAYIGDDVNCKELLEQVGVSACPANATVDIKKLPNIIQLSRSGGDGAVREFIDIILRHIG